MVLFDEYAARFARGERPDAREYLTRAGNRADELGRLIDAYLARATPPPPDEEARALAAAWLEGRDTPLLELRRRRGLRRDQVIDTLMRALALDAKEREKVKRYYHELESGLLEPRRVDRSVWTALAEALRARAADLQAWRVRPAEPAPAYFRAETGPMASLASPPPPAAAEPEEPDEIDRLFRGA